MECNRAIPDYAFILKRVTVCFALFTEFTSTYYNDMYETFGFIFRKYIKLSLKYIDNSMLTEEWKLNLDESAYEKDFNLGVEKMSLKKN